jgi:hypothetical protein
MNNRALTNSTKIRQNSIAGKGDEKIRLEWGTSCNLKASDNLSKLGSLSWKILQSKRNFEGEIAMFQMTLAHLVKGKVVDVIV